MLIGATMPPMPLGNWEPVLSKETSAVVRTQFAGAAPRHVLRTNTSGALFISFGLLIRSEAADAKETYCPSWLTHARPLLLLASALAVFAVTNCRIVPPMVKDSAFE